MTTYTFVEWWNKCPSSAGVQMILVTVGGCMQVAKVCWKFSLPIGMPFPHLSFSQTDPRWPARVVKLWCASIIKWHGTLGNHAINFSKVWRKQKLRLRHWSNRLASVVRVRLVGLTLPKRVDVTTWRVSRLSLHSSTYNAWCIPIFHRYSMFTPILLDLPCWLGTNPKRRGKTTCKRL
jgi:hypothetical protein